MLCGSVKGAVPWGDFHFCAAGVSEGTSVTARRSSSSMPLQNRQQAGPSAPRTCEVFETHIC